MSSSLERLEGENGRFRGQWNKLKHNHFRSTESGENFKLLVFVNDADSDVTEGSDGVEHM